MVKKALSLFIVTLLFSIFFTVSVKAENKPQLAVIDSARLLKVLGQKLSVAGMILSDYQQAIKGIDHSSPDKKLVEKQINQTLEEILAFYSSQLIRPLMLELNKMVSEKRFFAIINKTSFKLEDLLLNGTDARPSTGDNTRNQALEKLEKPFLNGVYYSEHQAVEITDALLLLVEKHFQTTPLVRFSTAVGKEKEIKK
ncbi:MAG: hypothetical protein ACOYXC_17700 [Candidatus Rifleibacteriota bacterium]